MLPPEMNSTNSAITCPMPVSVTVPTMMPAAAVAQAMPIMLREPRIRPWNMSAKPSRVAAATSSERILRNSAFSGFWVTSIESNRQTA